MNVPMVRELRAWFFEGLSKYRAAPLWANVVLVVSLALLAS